MGDVMGVAGLAGRARGKLGSDGLAEYEPARRSRERHTGGVGSGLKALIGSGAVSGRHVAGIHDVLDADRDAVERPAPRAAVERLSCGQRLFRIEMLPGANDWLALDDALEIGAGQRFGGQAAALHALG